jgi:E3 ubiquitin-protein ligase MARCH6
VNNFVSIDCLASLRIRSADSVVWNHFYFSFSVYSPDMPKRLPIKDIVSGLFKSIGRAIRYWFHYTLVAVAWLGVVPLTACK